MNSWICGTSTSAELFSWIGLLVGLTFHPDKFSVRHNLRDLSNFFFDIIRKSLANKVLNKLTQPEITCSKLTVETLEQGVKYVQS